ncbi:hypothetical protein R6Z07F_011323 [Ovis aries]
MFLRRLLRWLTRQRVCEIWEPERSFPWEGRWRPSPLSGFRGEGRRDQLTTPAWLPHCGDRLTSFIHTKGPGPQAAALKLPAQDIVGLIRIWTLREERKKK